MSRISVVIPVRDGERYLGAAIESVLAQSVAPAEVVVVDDGSNDASAAVAGGFGDPVRVVTQAPRGIADAVNCGIEATGEDLVAMLDADDLWIPEKSEIQLAALAADSELEAVFGHAQQFASPDLEPGARARLAWREEPTPVRSRGTMLIRRTALERVGPLDPTWRVGEFVDWHARADELGLRSAMLDQTVLRRRLHVGNHGRAHRTDYVDYVRIARAAVLRRRAAAR